MNDPVFVAYWQRMHSDTALLLANTNGGLPDAAQLYAQWRQWLVDVPLNSGMLSNPVRGVLPLEWHRESRYIDNMAVNDVDGIWRYFDARVEDWLPLATVLRNRWFDHSIKLLNDDMLMVDMQHSSLNVAIFKMTTVDEILSRWITRAMFQEHSTLFLQHGWYNVLARFAYSISIPEDVQDVAYLLTVYENHYTDTRRKQYREWQNQWDATPLTQYPAAIGDVSFWNTLLMSLEHSSKSTIDPCDGRIASLPRMLPQQLHDVLCVLEQIHDWSLRDYGNAAKRRDIASMIAQTCGVQAKLGHPGSNDLDMV